MDKETVISKVKEGMEKSIRALQSELMKVRTGRAQASLLDDVRVESYGSLVPLKQIGTVATPEARLITINPFDKSLLGTIEKAILVAGLNLTPNNDGKIIRIPIPALSEDRRKDLVKQVKKMGEEAKIAIRHHRQESKNVIKKGDGWTEDDVKITNDDVQKITDNYIKKVDELTVAKEKEVMTV